MSGFLLHLNDASLYSFSTRLFSPPLSSLPLLLPLPPPKGSEEEKDYAQRTKVTAKEKRRDAGFTFFLLRHRLTSRYYQALLAWHHHNRCLS